jgi:hypothetical protein
MAWSNGYQYRAVFTAPHTAVSADVTNGVITRTFAFGAGRFTSASGYDCIFTSDAAGATRLDHEIEPGSFVAATGTITVHIRTPTYSSTVDPVLYAFVGNAAIAASQENVSGVWGASAGVIAHLGDGTTLSLADSSANANTGTNSGATAVAGQIGGAAHFAGAQGIGFPDGASVRSTTDLTLSAWVQLNALPGAGVFAEIICKNGNYILRCENSSFVGNVTSFAFLWWDGTNIVALKCNAPATGAWHLLEGVVTANAPTALYLDGVLQSATPFTYIAGSARNTTGTLTVGYNGSTEYITADIDEVHIATAAYTAARGALDYACQSALTTFGTLGTLMQAGSGTATGVATATAGAQFSLQGTATGVAAASAAPQTQAAATATGVASASAGARLQLSGTVTGVATASGTASFANATAVVRSPTRAVLGASLVRMTLPVLAPTTARVAPTSPTTLTVPGSRLTILIP